MKNRTTMKNILIITFIASIFFITVVPSIWNALEQIPKNIKYNRQLGEYQAFFNDIVAKIDPNNISNSIKNNNLSDSMNELNKMFINMEKDVPTKYIVDFIFLRTNHEFLEEVITKGVEWKSLNNLDKLSIESHIEMLKSNI